MKVQVTVLYKKYQSGEQYFIEAHSVCSYELVFTHPATFWFSVNFIRDSGASSSATLSVLNHTTHQELSPPCFP